MDICTCLLAALLALAMAGTPLLVVKTSQGKTVELKEKRDKAEFIKPPTVSFPEAIEGEKYALFMVDPDAPAYVGTEKYWFHWFVVNIEGADMKKGDFSKATTLKTYAGPTPPPGNDHRYQFFLYKQPPGYDPTTPEGRSEFWLKDFVVESGLAKAFENYAASFYFLSAY